MSEPLLGSITPHIPTQPTTLPNPPVATAPVRKTLRPSQVELQNTPLKPTVNGQLAKNNSPLTQSMHVRSRSLQVLLENRQSKESLVAKNVVSTNSISHQAQKLASQKRRDSLQGFLAQRPTLEALQDRNILMPEGGDEHLGVETAIATSVNESIANVRSEFIGVPHRVEGLTDIIQVACGWSHSLALSKDGFVYSWGSSLNGRLGRLIKNNNNNNKDNNNDDNKKENNEDKDPESSSSSSSLLSKPRSSLRPPSPQNAAAPAIEHCSIPTLIPGLKGCTKIACGDHHNAAICADGLYVWGRNEFGVLGVGTREDVWIPTKVDLQPIITSLGLPENSTIEDVALGANHTVIIIYGKALAAGWNKNNRLGLVNLRHFLSYSQYLHIEEQFQDTTVIPRFQPIKGLSAPMRAVASTLFIRNVAAGDVMTIAVADIASTQQQNYNNVFLWGTSMHSNPYPIIELNGVEITSVKMGSNFSALLTGSGEVYCFGSNRDYQLGRPASSDLSSFHAPGPIIIDRAHYDSSTGYPRFTHIACGKYHGLAIDSYGKLYGWGLNKHGILGLNSAVGQFSPTPIDVTSILNEQSQHLFNSKEEAEDAKFRFVHADGGAQHSLCVDSNGFVYAMGSFRSGKLGL